MLAINRTLSMLCNFICIADSLMVTIVGNIFRYLEGWIRNTTQVLFRSAVCAVTDLEFQNYLHVLCYVEPA